MAIKGRRVLIQEKTGTDTLVNIYPDTVAERVWYDEDTSIKEKLDNEVQGLNSKIENLNTGVTGVKGDSETSYRTGQVNITKANIGLGNVENRGVDTTPTANSKNYVESGGVYTAINDVTAIAEGKTNTYVIDTTVSGYANTALNINKTIGITEAPVAISMKLRTIEGYDVNLTDLRVGDIVLVTSSNVFDWWVSSIQEELVLFCTFEAEKVDLANYATKAYADGVPTTNIYEFYENSSSGYKVEKTVVDGIKDLYVKTNNNSSGISAAVTRITSIENGTTAALKANQLTNARNISLSGDATGSGSFDGSKDITITTTIGDGKITTSKLADSSVTGAKILDGTITESKFHPASVSTDVLKDGAVTAAKLDDSGVSAGTYSAVEVNTKGIVTKGANYIEYGTASNNTPSSNLVIGGLFFSFISES